MRNRTPVHPVTRILSRIEIDPRSECWVWQGGKNQNGYGQLGYTVAYKKTRFGVAHRVLFEHLVGPVPDGHELDHLCRNRGCVNPDHLEPVTHLENMRRGANARHRFDTEFLDTIAAEYRSGMTLHQIAARHEMHFDSVRLRLIRHGVQMRPASRRRPA